MPRKSCFVPTCTSNRTSTPGKIFLHVPVNSEQRRRWCEAVGYVGVNKSKSLLCCEDHFDLENDAKNWCFFKTIGSRLLMKSDVIPHKNLSTPLKTTGISQLTESEKKRKVKVLEKYISDVPKTKIKKRPGPENAASDVVYLSEFPEMDKVISLLSDKFSMKPRDVRVQAPVSEVCSTKIEIEEEYLGIKTEFKEEEDEVMDEKDRKIKRLIEENRRSRELIKINEDRYREILDNIRKVLTDEQIHKLAVEYQTILKWSSEAMY